MCVCVRACSSKQSPIVFVVTTQGTATSVHAVGAQLVASVFTTSVREYTMQARIGKDPSILGVRDTPCRPG